jgi:hypothetical protein
VAAVEARLRPQLGDSLRRAEPVDQGPARRSGRLPAPSPRAMDALPVGTAEH